MKTYIYSIMQQVEVQAPDDEAASEIIADCFGEGETCGVTVLSVEVLDFEELS